MTQRPAPDEDGLVPPVPSSLDPEHAEPRGLDPNTPEEAAQEPVTYSEDIADLDLSPAQEREAETYLDDPEAVDDVAWSPPEQRPLGSVLAEEDPVVGVGDPDSAETIDDRLRQEEPEPDIGRRTGAEADPDAESDADPDATPSTGPRP